MKMLASVVVFTLTIFGSLSGQALRFADLGDYQLENESVIKNCRVAYRTFGALNDDRSNVVLFPSWFSGTTENLARFIGPRSMVDSSEHFVIAVGAFGNGVSSSPSNSPTQGGGAFPEFTIGDMVTAQHRLLTEVLGIRHVRAVVGISMGGMQAFEWLTSYPRFMDQAVSIVGSPKLGAYDMLLWQAELNAIERALAAYSDARKARAAAMSAVAELHELAIRTPGGFNAMNQTEQVEALIAKKSADLILRADPHDWASQLRAMMTHDIFHGSGISMDRITLPVKGKLLVIVAEQDHMVTPDTALEFAQAVQAETLVVDGDCGHLVFECDEGKVAAKVRKFLAQNSGSLQPADQRIVNPRK